MSQVQPVDMFYLAPVNILKLFRLVANIEKSGSFT